MAAIPHHWRAEKSVARSLRQEPFRFEFFQAVRILEAIRSRLEVPDSDRQMTATSADREIGIRFRSRVSFGFPASEVHSIKPNLTANQLPIAEMTVNFLGLAGALGPLPHAYTEMILDAAARRDLAAIDFLDIFNHRLIWLLYRARKAHHVTLTYESPFRGETAQYLFALIGLGPTPLRDRLGVPDSALLYYSGLLARNVRTAAGLERILADYFGVRARLHQFVGRWRNLDQAQWTTIGARGLNRTLGEAAVLGRRVWDQSGGVTVELGPLSPAQLHSFLPGGTAHVELAKLTRFYLGQTYRTQIRLQMRSDETPEASLGVTRLGYTSWMSKSKPHGSMAAVNFFLKD